MIKCLKIALYNNNTHLGFNINMMYKNSTTILWEINKTCEIAEKKKKRKAMKLKKIFNRNT